MDYTDIHLIRHGQIAVQPGTLVGATDVPLTSQGRSAMRGLGPHLPRKLHCLCSPMQRTRQSLECLAPFCNPASVELIDALREMDFGDYEMRSWQELVDAGEDLGSMAKAYHHYAFPGGEAVADFAARLEQVVGMLHGHREQGRSLLLISHGGVIRTLICLLLGLDISNYLLFEVGYGSWTTVRLFAEGGVLTRLNHQP